MLKQIYLTLKAQGPVGLLSAVHRKIAPQRARCLDTCHRLIADRRGLEVGGPSGVFASRGVLPVYDVVAALDNCNFASRTHWEGSITEGPSYRFSSRHAPGTQYVAETTDLSRIESGSYDFLLSSHVIEHTANPIAAVLEWIRVLKSDGVLVLLVPHKDGTFDHRRPVTPLEHLVDDHTRGIKEDDLTHLDEILALHDLKMDPEAGTPDQFRARSLQNLENRCLHHHVFDSRSVARLLDHVGLQIHAVEAARPNHVIAIAQKLSAGKPADNRRFLAADATFLRESPFPSDHQAVLAA